MGPRTHAVGRAALPMPAEPAWDSPAWEGSVPLEVAVPVGGTYDHAPRTRARLRWDERHLHVVFRVEDRYVRCVTERYQGSVCLDSCVELFFTPGGGLGEGYFNIEVNCGGTALFHHQRGRGEECRPVSAEDGARLEVAHTLPSRVEPEIIDPVTWLVSYRVPFAVLERYAPVERPRPGAEWRANLYKCGDRTSHPHWLAWSPVDVPKPDFHRPEFFGTLRFAP